MKETTVWSWGSELGKGIISEEKGSKGRSGGKEERDFKRMLEGSSKAIAKPGGGKGPFFKKRSPLEREENYIRKIWQVQKRKGRCNQPVLFCIWGEKTVSKKLRPRAGGQQKIWKTLILGVL